MSVKRGSRLGNELHLRWDGTPSLPGRGTTSMGAVALFRILGESFITVASHDRNQFAGTKKLNYFHLAETKLSELSKSNRFMLAADLGEYRVLYVPYHLLLRISWQTMQQRMSR